MKSRAARLTLLLLFMLALGVTAYLFRAGESLAATAARSARAFDTRARAAEKSAVAARAEQQAYVAAGQNAEFWANRVAASIDSLQEAIARLRAEATSPDAQSELELAASTVASFTKLDKRARDYARSGQNLLASDLVFGDGLEMIEAIRTSIEQARIAELTLRDASVETFHARQLFALLAAAAASLLVVLLLMPRVEVQVPVPTASAAPLASPPLAPAYEPADLSRNAEGWAPARPLGGGNPQEEAMPGPDGPPPGEAPLAAEPARPSAEPPTDFAGIASLCTELARVDDTRELPLLLERAATLLDAAGIILWIADPDGRELNPILAQGYSPQLLTRLGVIHRDAENATAAAFRTSLVQTVDAAERSNGAIAAPLVTPAGCVGVMAAELRNRGEKLEARLAATRIVAAQLATLVGPPVGRNQQVEAAGA